MDVRARPLHAAPPARPLVDRTDLLAALARAAAGKATVISAPAGSGKTCLLRAWAASRGQRFRVAELQVQRDQQDAQQFWLALLAAVRTASGTQTSAEPPAATPGFDARAMVDRVRSELEEERNTTFLVIDDLHELTSPEALSQQAEPLTARQQAPAGPGALPATARLRCLGRATSSGGPLRRP